LKIKRFICFGLFLVGPSRSVGYLEANTG